jgi:hypothetical protein
MEWLIRRSDNAAGRKPYMRKLVLIALAIFSLTAVCSAQERDQYGGLKSVKCRKSTGHFSVEKLENRWWFCTPSGNGFFMEGVYAVEYSDDGYKRVVQQKYGSLLPGWMISTNERLKSWGFNALGIYSMSTPLMTDSRFPLDSRGQHTNPIKLPFIPIMRPALYAMRNPSMDLFGGGSKRFLREPVKNLVEGLSPYYTGWRPPVGVADYFDPKFEDWLITFFRDSKSARKWKDSPERSYIIGVGSDDGDEMYGFGAGDEFASIPPGHTNAHLGWMIATMSPIETAAQHYKAVFNDTAVYTKAAWRNYLINKYQTIAKLNAAWGADYTTFDSSGVPIKGEIIGTANGSTTHFKHTVQKLVPSPHSVQILLNSTPIGGDTGEGFILGPDLEDSRIDYYTGRLILNFVAGKAPPAGSTISVNYVQNGWKFGTGLMDEDGRPSHKWMGRDYTYLRDTNRNTKVDLDGFLFEVADRYLGECYKELQKALPGFLFLGPDSLGSYGVPPRSAVLEAAAKDVDVLSGPGELSNSQKKVDFIAKYFGDKPIIDGQYRTAQADSAWHIYPHAVGPRNFATQQERGRSYLEALIRMRSMAVTSTGSHPFIGEVWWQYTDNRGEKLNWGLVSLLDNAYDGHEDVTSRVPCSPPLQKFTCGGEAGNYGDVITLVREANRSWLRQE